MNKDDDYYYHSVSFDWSTDRGLNLSLEHVQGLFFFLYWGRKSLQDALHSSSTGVHSLCVEEVILASDVDFIHSSLQVFSSGYANEEHLTNGPTRPLNSISIFTQSINAFKFAQTLAL